MRRANVRPGRWAFQVGDVKLSRSTLVKTWRLICKSGAGKIYAHANGFPKCSTTQTRDGVKGKHVATLRELLELANVGTQREQMKRAHGKASHEN